MENGTAVPLHIRLLQVWGPNEPVIIDETTDEEVVGDASEIKDDAKSVASCPVGKVVTFCESSTGELVEIILRNEFDNHDQSRFVISKIKFEESKIVTMRIKELHNI